ncbi:ankyrin repeat-containing domain protein [Thelonectria olida]|uniref:Ankyrin repeat-containing domain protein n=1 Tax=Thelonectria olida TaxID=1576542 RepID=A0A9P8VVN1_9HYPO|nr:ankyrin repeat-containing domain protein [Thelonectria olida]
MNACHLPTEILLHVAKYVRFSAILNWSLTNHEHYACMKRILYLSLPRTRDGHWTEVYKKPPRLSQPQFRGLVLAWAAGRGNLKAIEDIFCFHPKCDYVNDAVMGSGFGSGLVTRGCGMTAMHQAARHGHVDVIDLLVKHGADVEATMPGTSTRPIHIARNGDVVRALVRNGSSFNALSSHEVPPAIAIIDSRLSLDGIKALIEISAGRLEKKHDLAWKAVTKGYMSVLRWVLQDGLTEDEMKNSTLIYFAIFTHQQENPNLAYAMVELLIGYGAPTYGGFLFPFDFEDCRTLTTEDTTGSLNSRRKGDLHVAAVFEKSQKMVELLLRHGANTMLQCGTPNSDASGPSPNSPMTVGVQLLCHAATGRDYFHPIRSEEVSERTVEICEDRLDTVSLMLRYGFDINHYDDDDRHLLVYILCITKHSHRIGVTAVLTILFMLDNGADLKRMPMVASMNGPPGLARYPIHELLTAAWFVEDLEFTNCMQLLRRMLELGADPNVPDSEGRTPLGYACRVPNPESALRIVNLLVDFGADDKDLSTLLHRKICKECQSEDDKDYLNACGRRMRGEL